MIRRPGDGLVQGPTTLVGTVEEAVERGLVLLGPDGRALAQLLGVDAAAVPLGVAVEVDGSYVPDLRTTTQQGVPFEVTAVRVR